MRTLITGATGFIGRRLLERLQTAVVLSRNAANARQSLAKFEIRAYPWDANAEPPPPDAFAGIDAIIHLAGEPVAEGRWTEAKKQRIRDSRVIGTRNLVETLARLDSKPRVLISGSAVGYYGSRGDQVLDESAAPADDFLAEVCVAWEAEALKAREFGVRVVTCRTGIVLGKDSGALAKMLTPFKMGAGGRLADGRQWMPWIHIDDLVDMILFAAEKAEITGAMNGAAPHPVTNNEFTKTLGKVLRRPTLFPMPGFMLRLAFGEFGTVLLSSQRVIPTAAQQAGFQFKFPELEPALRAIIK